MPSTVLLTFAMVNSSAMTARQPEVPNLIGVLIAPSNKNPCGWLGGRSLLEYTPSQRSFHYRGDRTHDRQDRSPHHRKKRPRVRPDCPASARQAPGGLRQPVSAGPLALPLEGQDRR